MEKNTKDGGAGERFVVDPPCPGTDEPITVYDRSKIAEALPFYDDRDAELVADALNRLNAEWAKKFSEEDRSSAQLIEERDAAEEIVSALVHEITGAHPEWSNHYGLAEALEDCVVTLVNKENELATLREQVRVLRWAMETIHRRSAPLNCCCTGAGTKLRMGPTTLAKFAEIHSDATAALSATEPKP